MYKPTLQRVVGLLRLPSIVDHRPTPCLWKPHTTASVGHSPTVEHLVVPGDVVTVVRCAVVPEVVFGRQRAPLMQVFGASGTHSVWNFGMAVEWIVVLG